MKLFGYPPKPLATAPTSIKRQYEQRCQMIDKLNYLVVQLNELRNEQVNF